MFAYFALHPALARWRRRRRAAGVPDEVLDLLAVNVREIGVGHVEDPSPTMESNWPVGDAR